MIEIILTLIITLMTTFMTVKLVRRCNCKFCHIGKKQCKMCHLVLNTEPAN